MRKLTVEMVGSGGAEDDEDGSCAVGTSTSRVPTGYGPV